MTHAAPIRAPRAILCAALTLLVACGGGDEGGDGDNNGGNEPPPPSSFQIESGGNNVPERFSSDLWVHGDWAYTGTWGGTPRTGSPGDVIKVWSLDATGAPSLADSVNVPGVATVSDVQVTEDGAMLVASAENGPNAGLYVYDLTDPRRPGLRDSVMVQQGLHTATVSDINGRRYVFAARNPPSPALVIYDITTPDDILGSSVVPVPPSYGIHDTFVREGLAFVCAWNTGVIIYDVGNGIRGGSPTQPVEVSRLLTAANNVPGGPAVHNGWWFHNPVRNERRYLFLGQEGSGILGSSSSGDLHVVDVSDLAHPREVAFFHLTGAGTHNFWMDEARQVLYMSYYNGGLVALDVSGVLEGNLVNRLIAQVQPGGMGNTYVWGVQVANGSLYAIDMLSGLWQLKLP